MQKRKFGLLGKMVLNYSAILLALIFVLCVSAYRYVLAVSQKNVEINQQQLSEKIVSQVETYLAEMDNMALNVSSNTKIVNLFSDLHADPDPSNYFTTNIMESIDTATVLASLNGPSAPIWRINVYNQNGDYISSGANVEQFDFSKSEQPNPLNEVDACLRNLESQKPSRIISQPRKDPWSGLYESSLFISIYRPVTDYYAKEIYGVVEIQQDLAKLQEAVNLEVLTGVQVFVFNQDDEQVLPLGTRYDEPDSEQNFITHRTSSDYGWTVTLIQSKQDMMAPYRSMIWYLVLVAVLIVLCLLIAVYVISRRISKPITDLSKAVRKITLAEIPESFPSVESTDEIIELNAAYNSMMKKIKDSIAVEQHSYLLALQSQMDPHFLYNSLTVISGMGLEEGNIKVMEACDKLSNMLRYSTSYDTKQTTLRDELEHVKNYLALMKLRYEEYFTYTLDVDENMMDMPLPRLILQPIVENCFEHGFRDVPPPWQIDIFTKCDRDTWRIQISDNGVGIHPDDIKKLQDKVEQYGENLSENFMELKIGGMGLINTIIRFKLSSSANTEYQIFNNEPMGTVVMLKGAMIDDSGTDR